MPSSSSSLKKPSNFHIWFTAARPHTLTASLCPCLVAYAYLQQQQQQQLPPPKNDDDDYILVFLLWTVFCTTIQLGTNLHNDYADFMHGADDKEHRVGQKRATAQGWLHPTTTCWASCGCLTVAVTAGIILLWQTNETHNWTAWFLILTSVFNAFAYTGGDFPLPLGKWNIAYCGLGEIFVFAYFGMVAVCMLPYLVSMQQQQQTGPTEHRTPQIPYLYGAQVGLLAINIIVVNNLRDRHTDVVAHKRTTAVRFGRHFCLCEYVMCLLLAYELVLVDFYLAHHHHAAAAAHTVSGDNGRRDASSLYRLLPFCSLPLAVKEARAVFTKEGAALNPHVGGAAKVQVAFCVLLTVGMFLSSSSSSS